MTRILALALAAACVLALPVTAAAHRDREGDDDSARQQQGAQPGQTVAGDDDGDGDGDEPGPRGRGRGRGRFAGQSVEDCVGRRGWRANLGADFEQFRGTVTAVDNAAGTITATLKTRGSDDPQTATFKTDEDTTFYRNGDDATLSSIQVGDRIEVLILADEGTTPEQALNEAAFVVSAYSARQASTFAFAGKVTAKGDNTVTVRLRYATPAARALLPNGTAKGQTLTFAIGDDTQILVGRRSAELTDVNVGDAVALGVAAPQGSTLEQVLATPVEVLLDLRRKGLSDNGASMARSAAQRARAVTR